MAPNQLIAAEQEIELGELFRVFWVRKWFVCWVTAAFTALAISAVLLSQKKYDVVTVLSPVSGEQDRQGGILRSLASQFSGIGSLAGLTAGGPEKAEAIAVLQSDILTRQYIEEKNLLPVLYSDRWDSANSTWKPSRFPQPTTWLAVRYFKSICTVATDSKTGLVTLKITWTNPKTAAQWANDLVRNANNYVRAKAIARTERNIAYLNAEAAKAEVVGIKQTIYTLLQSEISNAMLARGNDEYAFKVLDPAVPPERPSSPRPLLWTAIGVVSGLAVSFIAILIQRALSK